MVDIVNESNIDPKILKKQEKRKLLEQLAQQKALKKQQKLETRKKMRADYLQQQADIKKLEQAAKTDIKSKLTFYKQQVNDKQMLKKEAKLSFKEYRKKRLDQFYDEQQQILHMSSHELKSSLRYRLKRWFFGVGKEFSRVTWTGAKYILKDFIIIIVIVAIMALLFLGVDYILRLANVIK